MTTAQIFALSIFLLTIIIIVTERFDNTVIALLGASLMIVFHIIPLSKVMSYVSFNTLAVLIGMMLIVAILKDSGFFEYIALKIAKLCKGNSFYILLSLAILTAIFSAILDNVTTVILIGPITFMITKKLKVNPIPFVITEIFASNIGGTTTLIGDPPNIMIGSAANLNFSDFITHLFPITIIILVVTILIIYLLHKKNLFIEKKHKLSLLNINPSSSLKDKVLLYKGLFIIFFVILGFIFGSDFNLSAGVIAILGAVIYLLIAKKSISNYLNEVEWSTILFFTALFILVGGLESTGLINMLAQLIIKYSGNNSILLMLILLWLSAIVSSFLDNIPFVATLIPLILTLKQSGIDVSNLWWAISLGACLGGNGTLIGASANVVLSKISEKNGYKISFGQYFKIAFPLMILSIIIATIYLLM